MFFLIFSSCCRHFLGPFSAIFYILDPDLHPPCGLGSTSLLRTTSLVVYLKQLWKIKKKNNVLTVKLPSLLPRFTVCDQRKNMTAKSNHYTWKCNTNASRVLSCRSPLAGREPGRCWTCRSRSGPQSPPSPSHGSGRRPLETWALVFPRYFLNPTMKQ